MHRFPATLLSAWRALPAEIRYRPATPEELEAFEREYGGIPPAYREFLLEFGGGVVGSEWLDGIVQLPRSHDKFRHEAGSWESAAAFLIGWDGAGNPISIDARGTVVIEDHNFGGVREVAPSFEAFLEKELAHAL